MYFLYSIFLFTAFLLLLPYFLYQAFLNKKYLNNFRERLGSLPASLAADERPTLWIHAVSVGETLAAQTLVTALRRKFPSFRLIFSTTTATGQAIARARITEADGFFYYPFDWKFSVRRALNTVRPQAVILMESELWPNFLHECRQRAIPVVVANGRVSDRSFARSQKFAFWFRRLTADVTRFLMQSEADADRIQFLGAAPDKVQVTGNIKYDLGREENSTNLQTIAHTLNLEYDLTARPLIIAGSTSDGEEEILLKALEDIRRTPGLEDTRLLLAPRHPVRFDAVARLLDATRFQSVRRSSSILHEELAYSGQVPAAVSLNIPARNADVILLDSIGELAALYRYASVVFIGGSLVPKGGHNILEPAFDAKPIVVGPHMENFREITQEFIRREAVIQLTGNNDQELGSALKDTLRELLLNPEQARRLGSHARQTVLANRGATARTVEVIAGLL